MKNNSSDSLPKGTTNPIRSKQKIRSWIFKGLFILLVLAIGILIGYAVRGTSTNPTQEMISIETALLNDDPFIGSNNAVITIIEFGDFECPYCKDFHENIWPELQEQYPGAIRLVYRDFPLIGLHENAVAAAEAANCAGEQGKYWEYHDLLFLNQDSLSLDALPMFASQLGLAINQFNDCMANGIYSTEVEQDFHDAITLKITGTPTFFINGYRLEGSPPIEDFQNIIDSILFPAEEE